MRSLARALALVLVLTLALALAPRAVAAPAMTYEDFLGQLTDFDRLTRLQEGVHAGLFSSWDRAETRYWGANGDAGQYLRVDPNGEAVMMDQDGPGCIYRLWSANPQGKIRFYLDGADRPTFECDFGALFTGAVMPFIQPLVWKRSEGLPASDCYVPIPFARHIKVVADRPWGQYYQLNYLRFPADRKVASFRLPLTRAEEKALNAAAEAWSQPGRDPKPRLAGQKTVTRRIALGAGRKAQVLALKGPGCIRAIRVRASSPQRYYWRKLVLRATWDGAGQPQVLAPLGAFFGFDWVTAEYGSLVAGCQAGRCYFYYPMPFRKSARLDLQSFLEQPAEVTIEVEWAPVKSLPPDTLYFLARWRHEPHSATFDYPFIETAGHGQFAGVTLQIDHPAPGWWGEGDDMVWVDGDDFPPWIGTGSEDYFGDAWGIRYLPGPSWGCSYDVGARTCPFRWHFMDNIPFAERMRMTIENYPPYNDDYSSVAYWYQAEVAPPFEKLKGATYTGGTEPGQTPSKQAYSPAAFRDIAAADVLTFGLDVLDAQEAEDLCASAVSAGKAKVITDARLPYEFSMERAVDFGGAKAGQTLAEFNLSTPETIVYYFRLYTAPVPGMADLTVEADSARQAVAGRPEPGRLDLDGLYLEKGDHKARLVALTDGRAVLDCLQLGRAERAAGAIEAEDVPVVATSVGADTAHPSKPWKGASAGRALEFHATAPGQGMTLNFEPMRPERPYVLGVRPMEGPGAGVIQAFGDGKPLGPAFDLYAPDERPGDYILPLGQLPQGVADVYIRVVGKNPASQGYHVGLDYFRWEPLIIHPHSAEGVWATVVRCDRCEYRIQDLGPEWLGAHHLWAQPCDRDGFVELALDIPRDGDYDISARYTTAHDYAIIQATLDGRSLGLATDCYSPQVALAAPVSLGHVHLAAGRHALAFKAVDKNAASAGYLMGIDYVLVK